MNAAELASALYARPCAGGWIARCPAHEDLNPSLSIREGANGCLLLRCFAGCSFESVIAAVQNFPGPCAHGLPASDRLPTLDDAKRTQLSLRIWRESRPADGTLVERYLESRGITLRVPQTLRFHPWLRHPSGAFIPAMVAAVEHVQSGNDVVAVHRTWLALDGSGKAHVEPQKAALGAIRGGSVRLAPAGGVLCIAEGIETALSVQQATGIATWAALGASNLPRLQLPDCVREVFLCADADEPGLTAAREAAQRLLRQGRRVCIARPSAAKDFNDRLRA